MGRQKEGELPAELINSKRRLNLQVPQQVVDKIERMAQELGCTPTELARHLLKFGLRVTQVNRDGGGVYFQEPGEEKEKIFLDFM